MQNFEILRTDYVEYWSVANENVFIELIAVHDCCRH